MEEELKKLATWHVNAYRRAVCFKYVFLLIEEKLLKYNINLYEVYYIRCRCQKLVCKSYILIDKINTLPLKNYTKYLIPFTYVYKSCYKK